MNCEWRQKAILYADDELETAVQEQVASHLRNCSECSAMVIEQMELKKAVRVAGHRFAAPPELRRSIRQSLHVPDRRKLSWQWSAAVVAMLLVTALGLLLLRPRQPDPLLAEVVDQHVTTLASLNKVDVISTDNHTVKPWFQGRLPFSFSLPEVKDSPFTLIGAKVAYLQQSPGAELLYQIRKHQITVFIFQARQNAMQSLRSSSDLSFTVEEWVQGGLKFYLVTDAPREDAEKLVSMLRDVNGRGNNN